MVKISILNVIRKSMLGRKILNSRRYFLLREKGRIVSLIKSMGNGAYPTKELLYDIVDERRINRVPYEEYFLFGFMNLDKGERRNFVSDVERVEIANALNDAKNDPIFYDKSITYSYYKDFYHRDVISLSAFNEEEFAAFRDFTKKHSSFICKPVDGGCGTGIRIFDMEGKTADQQFRELRKIYNKHIVIEELIAQHKEFENLHPGSVNTIRMPTIRFDDRVELVHPFLRVGRGDSVTDNAGSGGIICALDADTGVVIATADESGNTYKTHPDSGVELIGFTVPMWEEAKSLVKKLALIVPGNRYSSWDIALTNDGWVMIEVNARGQFIWQYATKVGFRDEIESIMSEIKEK